MNKNTPLAITKGITIASNGATNSAGSNHSTTNSTSSAGKLQWLGVNESGAEFGNKNIPGVLGTDFIWPNTSAIQILMDTQKMNIFRVPILMERITPGKMTAALDSTYLAGLNTTVNFITNAKAFAVIDAQNFGRYNGSVFNSTSDFKTFWKTLATPFKDNANVVFDWYVFFSRLQSQISRSSSTTSFESDLRLSNNEFHDEPSNQLVANLNQACIDGVRAAGATTQYVFVEGTVCFTLQRFDRFTY